MLKSNLLIVDDNKSVLQSLHLYLKRKFRNVFLLENPEMILSSIEKNQIDIILLDMNYKTGINTGNEGLFWIKTILDRYSDVQIVPITAYGDVDLAVQAIKLGAFDFILKPWDNEKLFATLQAAHALRKSLVQNKNLEEKQKELIHINNRKEFSFLSVSPTMKPVLKAIEKVAKTNANVLVLGENGTGKELVARMIHNASDRVENIFMPVDLGAIPDNLLESELFGYKKGAFTDAKEDRVGKFEIASGGTLFLDEIGNLAYESQAKLLSVLENRKFTRLGSTDIIDLDIRLVSATNKNLNELVEKGEFREDLMYRINTIKIVIPPLRERKEDIPVLAKHYLSVFANRYNKPKIQLHDQAVKKLVNYPWMGNVRELIHTMEKAVIMSDGNILHGDDLLLSETKSEWYDLNKNMTLEDGEKLLIEKSLTENKGNISHSARKLGIGRQTLYRKIQKYGLTDILND